jgi:TPR repeat protein
VELIDNYVVRIGEFREIFRIIKQDHMENPPQHVLIQGQRGSGKTTLLLRLYYEVRDNPELMRWLIPIRFDEEQYNIRTAYKLWENIAVYLDDEIGNGFYGLYDEMRQFLDAKNYELSCFRILKKRLQAENKKLLVFIDNFGDMLNKFHKAELDHLYQVLAGENLIRIIGASSVPFWNKDLDELFLNILKVVRLDELDHKETTNLLIKLGDYYKTGSVKDIVRKERGRVEALRRLTGGVPRTIVLLYEIFVDNESGDSFRDLEAILDRVTPLYKHRMDDLSPQQQEIVHAIAMNWDAVGVREIAYETRMESKAVSAQLKLLEMSKIVSKIRTNIKNHFYQLNERFFNIWYLMRYGRKKDRNKVLWLVRFLENWCSEKELITRAENHLRALRQGDIYEKHALFMTEALSHTAIPEDLQYLMIRETRRLLTAKNKDLLQELSKSDRELYNAFAHNYAEKDYEQALKNLLRIRNKNDFVHGMLGFLYEIHLHDTNKAESYYQTAVKMGNKSMIYNLANLYETELQDYQKAEKYYLQAAQNGNEKAYVKMGLMFEKRLNDYKKAIHYYMSGVKHNSIDAMNHLGLMYQNIFRDYEKAKKYYNMAIKRGSTEGVNNLAWLYFIRKDGKATALSLLNRLNEKNMELSNSYVWSMILLWNNKFEKAIDKSREFIENERVITNFSRGIQPYLMMLIAKEQYEYTYNLFNNNKFNIRDKYKPIYYALMYFLRDTRPDEYIRMGSELKQTVDEIVDQIHQMQIDYA